MANLQRRLEQLEARADPERTTIVVNWEEDPEPPDGDTLVLTWEDAEDKGDLEAADGQLAAAN